MISTELCFLRLACLALQVDDVFAAGDLGEALKAVEAMEAAGLEAADARDKLTRITTAVKKVRQYPPFTLANRAVLNSFPNSSHRLSFTLV